MAIYTPTGLKIGFPLKYSFALIGRLYPKTDAFKVLKLTEGIVLIPNLLGTIVGLIAMKLKLGPVYIVLSIVLAFMLGQLIVKREIVISSLYFASTILSYIPFWILWPTILSIGYLLDGWKGLAAFILGKVLSLIINFFLISSFYKKLHAETGFFISDSEKSFINAYHFYASRSNITTNITMDKEEEDQSNWEEVFYDFSSKYPNVVSRSTFS